MNSPYIQAAMAHAMQAIMTGAPLPNNCYVMSIPIEQAQQMFSPWFMTGGVNPMMYAPAAAPYYTPASYLPMIGQYVDYPHSNALVPYNNNPYNNSPYYPANNYPMLDYTKSKKKNRHRRQTHSEPHPNVYNSSSFDSDMENLSWSRLFGHHHQRRASRDSTTPQKKSSGRRQNRSSSTSSTTTTSDETIRRVNVAAQQAAQAARTSSSSTAKQQTTQQQQQTKGSLPFKYSSEFVPGTAKKSSNKKETKLRSDDIFVVQHPQYPSGH